eukprot:TRINITY_DN416_c0_g1_i1.p1 TRINITY_DN416_c0_g1~~TRINITY_DN416_c0_g1_i1.p1  ORF type:complete len:981 (+),score=176.00 TRINITY_DN416_c0_g1_i1:34-2976(+)
MADRTKIRSKKAPGVAAVGDLVARFEGLKAKHDVVLTADLAGITNPGGATVDLVARFEGRLAPRETRDIAPRTESPATLKSTRVTRARSLAHGHSQSTHSFGQLLGLREKGKSRRVDFDLLAPAFARWWRVCQWSALMRKRYNRANGGNIDKDELRPQQPVPRDRPNRLPPNLFTNQTQEQTAPQRPNPSPVVQASFSSHRTSGCLPSNSSSSLSGDAGDSVADDLPITENTGVHASGNTSLTQNASCSESKSECIRCRRLQWQVQDLLGRLSSQGKIACAIEKGNDALDLPIQAEKQGAEAPDQEQDVQPEDMLTATFIGHVEERCAGTDLLATIERLGNERRSLEGRANHQQQVRVEDLTDLVQTMFAEAGTDCSDLQASSEEFAIQKSDVPDRTDQEQQTQTEDLVADLAHSGSYVTTAEKGTDCMDLEAPSAALAIVHADQEQQVRPEDLVGGNPVAVAEKETDCSDLQQSSERVTAEAGDLPEGIDQEQQVRPEDLVGDLSDHSTHVAVAEKETDCSDLQQSGDEVTAAGGDLPESADHEQQVRPEDLVGELSDHGTRVALSEKETDCSDLQQSSERAMAAGGDLPESADHEQQVRPEDLVGELSDHGTRVALSEKETDCSDLQQSSERAMAAGGDLPESANHEQQVRPEDLVGELPDPGTHVSVTENETDCSSMQQSSEPATAGLSNVSGGIDQEQQVRPEDLFAGFCNDGNYVAISDEASYCLAYCLDLWEIKQPPSTAECNLPGRADQEQKVAPEDLSTEPFDHETRITVADKRTDGLGLHARSELLPVEEEENLLGSDDQADDLVARLPDCGTSACSLHLHTPRDRLVIEYSNVPRSFERGLSDSTACSTALEQENASAQDALRPEFGHQYWSLPALSALAESGSDCEEFEAQQEISQSPESFNMADTDSSDDEIEYFPICFTRDSSNEGTRVAELEDKLGKAMSLLYRSLDGRAGVSCEEVESFLLTNYF